MCDNVGCYNDGLGLGCALRLPLPSLHLSDFYDVDIFLLLVFI